MTPFEDFNYAPQSYIVPNPEDTDFVVKLTQYLGYLGLAVQKKYSSIQSSDETVISTDFWVEQVNRSQTVYRKMLYFGTLPNNGIKSVKINLSPTADYRVVHFYGAATAPNSYAFPLPYFHPNPVNGILLRYDFAEDQISIQTGTDRSGYEAIITIEYIKNFK